MGDNNLGIFFSDSLHMHLLQSSHEYCEVSSGSNSKWLTYCHFCLLKLTKYLKILSVRMDISNTNENFFFDTIHMHLLPYPYEFCKLLSGSNSKWLTYCHFCLLKLTKYLKILSARMDISNTNEYFFSILYTCIYYHTLMNSVNFCPDQIQNGQLIAIFVCSN